MLRYSRSIGVGRWPADIVAADFNGDGRLDLATADYVGDTITILTGDGAGGFSGGSLFSAGLGPFDLAVGDLNGDGRPDLVSVNLTDYTFTILGNTPSGGWYEAYVDTQDNPVSLLVANMDGYPGAEIVASTDSNYVDIHEGDGYFGFGQASSFATPSGPGALAAGDLDGDGHPDLVVAQPAGDAVLVYFGQGHDEFGGVLTLGMYGSPGKVAVADLNGDGHPDIIATNDTVFGVDVWLADGHGGFGPAQYTALEGHSADYPSSLTVGDLNGDGRLDVVATFDRLDYVWLLYGDGAGGFDSGHVFTEVAWPTSTVIGDFNGDGRPDLAVTSAVTNDVTILLDTQVNLTGPALASRNEGDGATTFAFTVTRQGSLSGTAAVSYAVTGVGAHPADGLDFSGGVLPTGVVTFADGEASRTLNIVVAGDSSVEDTETFQVTLSHPVGVDIGAATATATIVDDDAPTPPPPPPAPPPSPPEPPPPPPPTSGGEADDTALLNGGDNSYSGMAGDDWVWAGGGADTLQGNAGRDTLYGFDGDDLLHGGRDDDRLSGGLGRDMLFGDAGDDTVNGDNGEDTLNGGDGQDSLSGDYGDDMVQGGPGADSIDGGAGNDTVRGGQGDDVAQGGAGDDWLSGDLGDDTLTGGAGADIFHVFAGAGADRVTDFNAAQGDRVFLPLGTAYVLKQVGDDTEIDLEGGARLILEHVTLSSLPQGWLFEA